MRIFYSFLIVMASAILFMIPIDQGVYDFKTNVKEDIFFVETAGGVTTANLTLHKEIYDDDPSTVEILSDLNTDVPALVNYTASTRLLDISGITASANRTLTISYDYDSLQASNAINNVLDKVPWIWLICVIVFAPCAIAVMWIYKGK